MHALILTGRCLSGMDESAVWERAAALFKLELETFRSMLLGRCPLVVRETEDFQEAHRIRLRLFECGAEAELVQGDGDNWQLQSEAGATCGPVPLTFLAAEHAALRLPGATSVKRVADSAWIALDSALTGVRRTYVNLPCSAELVPSESEPLTDLPCHDAASQPAAAATLSLPPELTAVPASDGAVPNYQGGPPPLPPGFGRAAIPSPSVVPQLQFPKAEFRLPESGGFRHAVKRKARAPDSPTNWRMHWLPLSAAFAMAMVLGAWVSGGSTFSEAPRNNNASVKSVEAPKEELNEMTDAEIRDCEQKARMYIKMWSGMAVVHGTEYAAEKLSKDLKEKLSSACFSRIRRELGREASGY